VFLSSILVGLFVLLGTGLVLTGRPGTSGGDMSSIRDLGLTLYKKYAFPFELASVLLLVAIIGAVALTRRHGQGLAGSVARGEDA
jgi:NADH-quinone oxidoreductase subunit J